MRKIVNIDTVCRCNHLAGRKTLHPLISVIDFSEINRENLDTLRIGFYSIILKEYACQHDASGWKECDYSDATIVFLAPGETIEMEKDCDAGLSDGQMLIFHPDLLTGTCLGMYIDEYTFFNYNKNEALHISMREKKVFMRCLENINEELRHSIDKHSRLLVTKSIDLLLSYCSRFYERQFITRSEENKQLMKKTDRLIYDYYASSKIKSKKLPSAQYCAGLLHLSPAYFTELLKHETGHTVSEYMQYKQIEIAKKWLGETNKMVTEIADTLGFSSPEYFSQLFKKLTGFTPGEYRLQN